MRVPITKLIEGQDSFVLRSRSVELALTKTGGMLGPVSFFLGEGPAIRPYAIAPWSAESLPADVPPMIAALRGDWFCSAFGLNSEPHLGHTLPPHGETANEAWHALDCGESARGIWLRTGVDLPLQGGQCSATTAILHDQAIVYQRHDLRGLRGPLNPGHHATLAFSSAGRLSFSGMLCARTFFESTERAEQRGYSWLRPNAAITDLSAVPCIDGSTSDLSRYPARRGYEDIVILCAIPSLDIAWSAVTFTQQGFVWFALRNPQQLVSTLLWFSNGGRHYPPWNGRHTNVVGIEDITGFFHVGIAASCRPNLLTELGVRTCIEPDAQGRLVIPYIQGVARIPDGFDCVAAIERDAAGIVLRSDSGHATFARCETDFLVTGRLSGLDLGQS